MPAPNERRSDQALIVGKNGTGKSVLARHKFNQCAGQRILIDVKGTERLPGVDPVHSVDDLDWTQRTLHYIPRDPSSMSEFDDLYRVIFRRRDLLIWLDEAFGPTTSNKTPKHIGLVLMQGRIRNLRHYACTQRPVNISKTLLSEASHLMVFPKGLAKNDRDTIAAEMGVEPKTLAKYIERLRDRDTFGDYGYLHYEKRRHLLHFRDSVTVR